MNKSILCYSPFGSGKTLFVGLLVRELLKKFPPGAQALLYSAEQWDSIEDLVDEGLVKPWKINTWDHPFDTLRMACDGMWPSSKGDSGNYDQTAGVTATSREDLVEKYPIRIYEGMATFSNYITGGYALGGMAQRIGAGEKIGPNDSSDGPVQLTDGAYEVGGISRSNFGFAQKRMVDYVQQSQRKPGVTIWTSHEDDVKEKRGGIATGQTVIGPEVFGGALTQVIGREFGAVWRLITIPTDYQQRDGSTRRVIDRRLYLKEHIDPASGMVAKAVTRVAIGKQATLPDFINLTDKDKPGQPRMDAAAALVERLGI